MKDIKVGEIMSRNPLIVSEDMSVRDAAKLLKKRGVSTIIISKDDNPIGIATDRDMVTKVIADGYDPERTRVRDIMSSPVVMISYDESISDAARVMSRRRIRKLPVVKDYKIVGLLSENDIVRIAPDLVALAREYAEVHNHNRTVEKIEEYVAGKCEACGQYSLRLRQNQGLLVCPECYDSMNV